MHFAGISLIPKQCLVVSSTWGPWTHKWLPLELLTWPGTWLRLPRWLAGQVHSNRPCNRPQPTVTAYFENLLKGCCAHEVGCIARRSSWIWYYSRVNWKPVLTHPPLACRPGAPATVETPFIGLQNPSQAPNPSPNNGLCSCELDCTIQSAWVHSTMFNIFSQSPLGGASLCLLPRPRTLMVMWFCYWCLQRDKYWSIS
jgi:hypothetical protein